MQAEQHVQQYSDHIYRRRYAVEVLVQQLRQAALDLKANADTFAQEEQRVQGLRRELATRNTEVATIRSEIKAEEDSSAHIALQLRRQESEDEVLKAELQACLNSSKDEQ